MAEVFPLQAAPFPRAISVTVWVVIVFLIALSLVFAGIRVITDTPHIIDGTLPPPESFEFRYVRYSALAYLHIVPGIAYLLISPWQLSRRFRQAHLMLHRRMGRVALGLGFVSGVTALAFGILFSHGGAWQALATAVFGSYFVLALLLAFTAIRRRDVNTHRRWMIRAFAVGLGVGSIRVWLGVLISLDVIDPQQAFVPAFWLGLGTHAIAAELWLRWRPAP